MKSETGTAVRSCADMKYSAIARCRVDIRCSTGSQLRTGIKCRSGNRWHKIQGWGWNYMFD